jgi:lactate dehydrogenase-like 2-hydroxyacid dehydrogenase
MAAKTDSRSKSILLVTPSACRDPERFEDLSKKFEFAFVRDIESEDLSPDQRDRVSGIWLNFDCSMSTAQAVKYPRLEFVATTSTGVNHIEFSSQPLFPVAIISLEPSSGELDDVTSTVEVTWALILAQFVRASAAHLDVISGHWSRSRWEREKQLSEQVLGIVGFGRIGQRVARVGVTFGMQILVTEIDPNRQLAAKLDGHSLVPLNELLERSHWVSLHADARTENSELISGDLIDGASPFHLVNTARGSLVSEPSVIKAIRSGKLLSYSADVLAAEATGRPHHDEEIVKEATMDSRYLLTPHIGGATISAYDRTEDIVAAKILDRVSGDI